MTLPPITRVEPLFGLEASADTLPQDAIERFASALQRTSLRADSVNEGFRVAASSRHASGGLDAQALIAADDTWVNILAISEKLHDGEVSPTEASALKGLLRQSWDAFQSQIDTLAASLPERGED